MRGEHEAPYNSALAIRRITGTRGYHRAHRPTWRCQAETIHTSPSGLSKRGAHDLRRCRIPQIE